MTNRKTIYLDSCIFLSILQGEKREADVLAGLEEIVEQIDRREVTVITSVLSRTEILEARIGPDARRQFLSLFDRTNVVEVNVDAKVADLASEIRSHYHQQGIKVGLPDATHLATAVLYEATTFYTFDGCGTRPRPADLLRLGKSGKIMQHRLMIVEPRSSKLRLPFDGQDRSTPTGVGPKKKKGAPAHNGHRPKKA